MDRLDPRIRGSVDRESMGQRIVWIHRSIDPRGSMEKDDVSRTETRERM